MVDIACPLCKGAAFTPDNSASRTFDIDCPACGSYRITSNAHNELQGKDAIAFDIASWVFGQTEIGAQPKVETSTIEFIRTFPRPSIRKRAELYLARVIRLLDPKLMGRFEANDVRLRVASWTYSNEDAAAIAIYLAELGAFERPTSGTSYLLTAKGHILYDEWVFASIVGSQVFVAMWFDHSMIEAYERGLAWAIKGSGYTDLRIDRKEHDGKIDDQIIAEIRRSAFMVADFTEHRGGVYYEAGFAHGLGKRVIFTCRSDHIEKLHFDVRQYNTILWQTPQDIAHPLQNRILALFGAGPANPDAKPLSS